MKPRRIMVVEDNATNMKLAQDSLELYNFEVCCVQNAEQTLAKINNFEPSVILMDIQLPDVDGLTLVKKIKSNPVFKDIFIIALTAYAMKGDREKSLAAGCDEYFAKPADIFELIKLIETYVGK